MRQTLRKQPLPLLLAVCGAAAALAALSIATGGAKLGGLWVALALASLGIVDNLTRHSFLRFHRESQTITCEEIAIIAAPLVATPAAVVLAVVLATLAGNLIRRRPLIKLTWNVGSFGLEAILAMLVFVALGGSRDGGARSLLAALAAGAVYFVLNHSMFALLLAKLGAGRFRDLVREEVRIHFIHAAGVLTIGFLGACALLRSTWTTPIVLVAVAALEFGIGGYARARAERDRVESLLSASSDGIFSLDKAGRITSWNPAMELLLGVPVAEAVGASLRTLAASLLMPSQVDELLDLDSTTVELAGIVDGMGTPRTLRVARSPLPDFGTILTVSDSTALASSIDVLRASRARLDLALQTSGAALWEWDADAGRLTWSENLAGVYGWAGNNAPRTLEEAHGGLRHQDVERIWEANRIAVETGEPYEIEVRALRPDGAERWLRLRADVVRNGDKTLLRGISQDISEVHRREEEQRVLAAASRLASSQAADAEQRMQRMLEQMNDGFYAIDRDWRYVYANDRGAQLLGRSPEELIGSLVTDSAPFGAGVLDAPFHQAMRQRTVARIEEELVEPGRWFEVTVHPVPEGIWLFTRETTEERHLEEQLRHAQKMDAVGRLAGGVAHDFNNLLTVINGYSSLALARALEVDAPLANRIQQVLAAGQRAAALTSQLLAFSRQQVLRARVVDLNATIGEVDGMLHRLLGPKIALETTLATDLYDVKADPGGIEQVLMNLCMNARDAIVDGGTISISTRNRSFHPGDQLPDPELEAGEYVAVSVSDSGTGISESVLPRIFEPFFTTKPAGSGTGLGLATAYGIVKQSGGSLTVASTLGVGTTFTILLPRTRETLVAEPGHGEEIPTGRERVLLVEDEEIVRNLTRDLLTSFGYSVIEAASAEHAIAVTEPFDLLVSDVVMPGMNGIELARRLTDDRPGLRVLLVSGHSTDDIRALDGNRRWRYLPKPFTPYDLAWTVRSLLDAPVDAGAKSMLAQR